MDYQAAFEKLKEEKDALLKDKDYLIQQQADEIERLRRDVKKQKEKMIELAKRSKALEADLDEWTEKAFVNQSKALENLRRTPKSGRWIVEQEGENGINIYCSECGKNGQFPKWDYCPNCGAKMGV